MFSNNNNNNNNIKSILNFNYKALPKSPLILIATKRES